MKMVPRGSDRNSGFVLIAVLTILALLSAMVVAMLSLSRDSIDLALLESRRTRQAAMVQSGISVAAYELFQLGIPPDQVSRQQFRLNDGVIAIQVTTDAAKADLNGSGRDLLAAAYSAAGLTALSPQQFAAAVIDWRDPDDDVSEGGAEAADYVNAKRADRPRNSPFRTVGDLRWVLGVTAADVIALRDYVTVYNPRGRLNVFAASPSIIRALPKVAPEIVDDVLQTRTAPGDNAVEELEDLLLVQAALIDAKPASTYRIRIDVVLQGAPGRQTREMVIAAGATPDIPYHILYSSGDL